MGAMWSFDLISILMFCHNGFKLNLKNRVIDIRPQNSEYTESFLSGGPNVVEI